MESLIRRRAQALAALLLTAGMLAFAGCIGTGTSRATYPMYDPSYDSRQPTYQQPVYASQPAYAGQPVYARQPVYASNQPVYAGQASPGTAQVAYTQDDYIYYPAAEVYYSPVRQEYTYREGTRWMTRRERPQYLNTGQFSVQVQIGDSPQRHHADIQRRYPHSWQPTQNRDYRDYHRN
jgi:hypothetical protein